MTSTSPNPIRPARCARDRKDAFVEELRGRQVTPQIAIEFDDAAMIFEYARNLGCEGIVSKRLGSRYVPGRTRDWIKVKNPDPPVVKREAVEEWK